MASQGSVNNLTTDACPSPPRDEKETSFSPEEKVTEELPRYTKQKKSKPKPKKSPTHAVANIININNANGIHIGSNFTINMGKSQTTENVEKKDIIKTEAICRLLERTDPVTKQIISFVSEHIGKNWKVVGRALGYSGGQLYQFHENDSLKGIREVVYKVLLDWIQNKPEEANVGKLFSTLWDASEQDVVQRMAHSN